MIKRSIVVLLLLGLMSCRDKSQTATATAPQHNGKPAIVFLGNSLTAGLGLPIEESFPSLIQQKIDENSFNYKVINGGRSGDTTAGGLARLPWYLQNQVNPRVLVVCLGSNDAMRGLATSTIKENLRKIIRSIREYDDEVKIMLVQLEALTNLGERYRLQYSQLFRQLAAEEKVTLMPFLLKGVGGVADLNQRDGIHPNSRGTAKVAETVWQALRPHL